MWNLLISLNQADLGNYLTFVSIIARECLMGAEYPEKKTQHSTDRRSPGPVSECPAKVHHARTELARLSRRPQSEDQKPGIMSQNRFQKTSIHFLQVEVFHINNIYK